MALTDINISEQLTTSAPSIRYEGNEGPKSPQEQQQMMLAQLEQEYEQYKIQQIEIDPSQLLSFEEWYQSVYEASKMGVQAPQEEMIMREPAAYGGIMDSVSGRRAYGWGSKLKSAFKSVTKPFKKVLGSDVGKTALLGAGIYGLGGGFGLKPGGFALGNLPGAGFFKPGTIASRNIGGIKRHATPSRFSQLMSKFPGGKVGAGLTAASLIPFTGVGMGEQGLEEAAMTGLKDLEFDFDYDSMIKEVKNLKTTEDIIAFNDKYGTDLVEDISVYNFAQGGRAGFYAGGQSIPSDYTMEDAMMTTTQDKLGGITDVMKQADLYRQGDVGQFYAADGGRIGFADGMNEKLAELKKAYDTYVKGGGTLSFEQFSTAFAEENFAQGGRIGAQEGGLMDLGGMEKDYRNDGGFVPIGGKEKADDVPARLSKNEFVFTADAVRGAGGGDIDKGAEIMENIMKNLEQGGQISEETQGLSGAQEMFDVSERLSEVV